MSLSRVSETEAQPDARPESGLSCPDQRLIRREEVRRARCRLARSPRHIPLGRRPRVRRSHRDSHRSNHGGQVSYCFPFLPVGEEHRLLSLARPAQTLHRGRPQTNGVGDNFRFLYSLELRNPRSQSLDEFLQGEHQRTWGLRRLLQCRAGKRPSAYT